MSHCNCVKTSWRRGLTLLELVIVLVVLAALTAIAVQSLEPVAEQARYEATRQSIQNIDNALLLRTIMADGVTEYTGFISDVGRVPSARLDSNGSGELVPEELWRLEDYDADGLMDIAPFEILPIDDPETTVDESDYTVPLQSNGAVGNGIVERIVVGAGWRGPYIDIPPAGGIPRDGFGRPLRMYSSVTPDVLAQAEDLVVEFVSFGTDFSAGNAGGPYDEDIRLPNGPLTTRVQGKIQYHVRMLVNGTEQDPVLAANQKLQLHVYGPSGQRSSAGLIEAIPLLDHNIVGSTPIQVLGVSTSAFSCGNRMVRVVIIETNGAQRIVRKSTGLVQLLIQPGGTSRKFVLL